MTKPKVILFSGVSLDGRMDGGSPEADMGMYYQVAASWGADAMLSGSNTMLAAPMDADPNPPEIQPVGQKELHPLAVPYMVIADSRGRIHNWRSLVSQPFWREMVALCSHATPKTYLAELDASGVPYILAGVDHVDFALALEELNTRFGIRTVRIDSGGILNGVLLRAGLVDEVSLLVGPALVGGTSPRSFFVADDITSPGQVIPLRLIHCEKLGENVLWLRYDVLKS
jgi:2,5-diamino-6-(ribosylamino)-4(3H)-pyrimidinone 5'-phosphate reductase